MSKRLSTYCDMTAHKACRGRLVARSVLPCECDCHTPSAPIPHRTTGQT